MSLSMPPKRGKKSKKYYKKKYGYNARVPRNMVGFPSTQAVKMRWCGQFQLNAVNPGIVTEHPIRANSIYDPDTFIGLGQLNALGYNQWRQFYNHFLVSGSRIKVEIFPTGNAATQIAAVGVTLDDDAQSISGLDYLTIAMQGKSKYKLVPTSQSTSRPTTLVNTFSAKNFFNVEDVRDNFDRLGASLNIDATPKEEAFYIIWIQSTDKTVPSVNYQVNVTVDYHVILSEPTQLPAST